MVKGRFIGAVMGVLLLAGLTAFAGGVNVAIYSAGDYTAGLFTNTTGTAVIGLHIEFDKSVTIINKVEVGGFLPAASKLSGDAFDLVGGKLAASGTVELDWQPADAKPTLVQWIGTQGPVGTPYFTTIEALGKLFGMGIVRLRKQNPQLLQQAFAKFFADNADYFAALSESLGVSLKDSLMPIIMSAPAEGIANFFNTLVGSLGVTDLNQLLHGDVDFTALLKALGL